MGGAGSGIGSWIRPGSHLHWGMDITLDSEFDAFDANDIELIQHVRETGEWLHADALGSGERHIGSWYNPAATQRARREHEKAKERLREARRSAREQEAQEARERQREKDVEAARLLLEAKEQKRQKHFADRWAQLQQSQLTVARWAELQQEQNTMVRWRADLERRCWEIAVESADHWGASDDETKLMWNMMRYQNLGGGRGQVWSAERFAALVGAPVVHINHCYCMLRDRHADRDPAAAGDRSGSLLRPGGGSAQGDPRRDRDDDDQVGRRAGDQLQLDGTR